MCISILCIITQAARLINAARFSSLIKMVLYFLLNMEVTLAFLKLNFNEGKGKCEEDKNHISD